MIAFAEGTANRPGGGYATLFGGGQFTSFADHPRQVFSFRNKRGEQLRTSAAGRYQFLARTWDELRQKLGLPDFGPESQDAAALELIRQRGALGDVDAGRLFTAIGKVSKVWASLPGAGYAQPERKHADLLAAYAAAGGDNLEA
ncbi:MAG: glycoside hydrolase family 104 protein [Burkholderiales bacterium]|nr:glycoside hydrolase family 104 protein [Burkholderiales bacterium]